MPRFSCALRVGRCLRKGVSFFAALSLLVSLLQTPPAVSAEPAFNAAASFRPFSRDFRVPSELGTVETLHDAGPEAPVVFFIQDAHAVLDAQKNIRRLLSYLEKEQGVRLVGLEAGEGKLDPLVFRAFPDDFLKEKVMSAYLARGELSGAGLAALFSAGTSSYYGIEDWRLYGENYQAYLRSAAARPEVLEKLEAVHQRLEREKKKIFTPELAEFQDKSEAFYEEHSHLLEYLQFLKTVSGRAGLDEAGVAGRYPHLSVLWESLQRERRQPSLDMDASIRRMAKGFQEHYLARLDRKTQMEFNGVYQQFLSGQMEAGKFLRILVETGKNAGIQPKLTPEMKDLLGHTEKLSQIKGTRLFDELESLSLAIEEKLVTSPEQSRLAGDFRRLRRLHTLAHLELSRDQLSQYQADAEGHLGLMGPEGRKLFEPSLHFYRIALERDRVFHEKLESLMKKENAGRAAVLAGGFHARGFEEELRANGYSYAVITPKIDSLEGSDLYEGIMAGKLSYGKDVTRSLYEAFVRHAAASLLDELNEPDFRKMMKLWRDEVLRRLAEEKRSAEAGEYTRALDALTAVYLKKFGAGQKTKSLDEVLAEVDRELGVFKVQAVENLWQRFEQGMERFFETRMPAARTALGMPIPLIPGRMNARDPVLMAVTEGPDEVLQQLPAAVTDGTLPVLDSTGVMQVLGDYEGASSAAVRDLPAVRELRDQILLSARAGDALSAEALQNPADFARILDQRVDAIVQNLPQAQRSQQGDAALKAAIMSSVRQDLAAAGTALQRPAAVVSGKTVSEGGRSELRHYESSDAAVVQRVDPELTLAGVLGQGSHGRVYEVNIEGETRPGALKVPVADIVGRENTEWEGELYRDRDIGLKAASSPAALKHLPAVIRSYTRIEDGTYRVLSQDEKTEKVDALLTDVVRGEPVVDALLSGKVKESDVRKMLETMVRNLAEGRLQLADKKPDNLLVVSDPEAPGRFKIVVVDLGALSDGMNPDPSGDEVLTRVQTIYSRIERKLDSQRSELRSSGTVELLPALDGREAEGLWSGLSQLNTSERYEATKDYVRVDGVFYVQRGAGYEQALARTREKIAERGKNEPIVVLLEAKQYRGALTFKHHFHTTLSLLQMGNVASALRDQSLIDLGSGSGVLGITVLLRDGAKNVLAVDLDGASLAQAQEALALTEQANSLAPGTLSSRFLSFALSYEQFGKLIAEDNFNLLRSKVSPAPVIITNNHAPWNVPALFRQDLGSWLLEDNTVRGLPQPSHIVVAGASYDDDSDDERAWVSNMEEASKRAYVSAALPGWGFKAAEMIDAFGDFTTTFIGATYQSPQFAAEIERTAASRRSELRADSGVLQEISARADALRGRFLTELEALKPSSPSGYASFPLRYTELLDRTLKDVLALYEPTGLPSKITLVVTGSLARRTPAYGTDIDALILADDSQGFERALVEHFVDTLDHVVTAGVDFPTRLAPLSRPVYTPTVTRLLADLDDLDVISLRNLIDSRVLAGNPAVYQRFKSEVIPEALKRLQDWVALTADSRRAADLRIAWSAGRRILEEEMTESRFRRIMARLTDTDLYSDEELGRIRDLVADQNSSYVDLLNEDSFYFHYLDKVSSSAVRFNWQEYNAKTGALGSRTINHLVSFGRVLTEHSAWDLDARERHDLFPDLVREDFLTDKEASDLTAIENFQGALKTAVNLSWEEMYPGETLDDERKDTLRPEIIPLVSRRLGMTEGELRARIQNDAETLRVIVRSKVEDYRRDAARSELRQTDASAGVSAETERALRWLRAQSLIESDRAAVFTANHSDQVRALTEALQTGRGLSLTALGEAGGMAVFRVQAASEEAEFLVFTEGGAVRDIAMYAPGDFMSYALDGRQFPVPLDHPDARKVQRYVALRGPLRAAAAEAAAARLPSAKTGTLTVQNVYVPASGLYSGIEDLESMARENPVFSHLLTRLSALPPGNAEENLRFRHSNVYELSLDEEGTAAFFDGRRPHFQMAFRLEDFAHNIKGVTMHELQHDAFRAISSEKAARMTARLNALAPELMTAMQGYDASRVLDEALAHIVEGFSPETDRVPGVIVEGVLVPLSVQAMDYLVDEQILPAAAAALYAARFEEADESGEAAASAARSELRHTGDGSEEGGILTRSNPFNFSGSASDLVNSVLSQPAEIHETLKFYYLTASAASREKLKDRLSAVSETTNRKPTVYIGDLHGRVDVLLGILKDTVELPEGKMTILEALQKGLVNLHQVGDIVHPNGNYESQEAHLNTFALFAALIALKNMAPENVMIIQGNHEGTAVGPKTVLRSGVNLDGVFRDAVIGFAGRGTGWGPVPNWDRQGGTQNRTGQDVGSRLYDLYRAAVSRLPTIADNHTQGSGIAMVHAGPSERSDFTLEDLPTLDINKADGTLYDQLLWTRASSEKGYEAVEHLDTFADKLGLSLLINGHSPFHLFKKEKGSAVQIYAYKGENIFGVLRGTRGAFQIVLDASNVQNHAGYLFLDARNGVPGKLEDFKGPDGKSAFRVIDVVNGGESVKKPLTTPPVPVRPQAAAASAKTPAAAVPILQREPRIFAAGSAYFRLQLEGETLVVYESDLQGTLIREMGRAILRSGESLVLGRDPERAHVVFQGNTQVSRVQAFIKREENGQYTLNDPGLSRNGTFAAGKQIQTEVLDFSENLGRVQEKGVRQTVYAAGTDFQPVPVSANGHVDVKALLVPKSVPQGQELVKEIRAYIESYITDSEQKKWALRNIEDPAILALLLPYMESARRANILFVVSQEIPNAVVFRFTTQQSLDILREIFDELPKELMWEMTAPQGYEYTETDRHVRGYQKMDDTVAGGAIGKFQDKKQAMETIVHEVLGHKRHNTKAVKFEFSPDGRQVRRLDGPDDWQIIVSGKDWERIAKINGVERVMPLTPEMREALESGHTVSFGANALDVAKIAEMPDQEVLNLMRRLFVHGFAYYNDLREILAFTTMGDDLAVPGPLGERNNRVRYEPTRRILLESAARVHSIPADPVNGVYLSYEYNPKTLKFDVFYLKNLGTPETPDWHKVLWHVQQKQWLAYEATAPDELRPAPADNVPEGIPAAEDVSAQAVPEVEAPPSVLPDAFDAVSLEVFNAGGAGFSIATRGDSFYLVEETLDLLSRPGPFSLQPGTVVRLGRNPENDVVIDSSNASRFHAEIRVLANGALQVKDLDSRNGVRVNGTLAKVHVVNWKAAPAVSAEPAREEEGLDELMGALGVDEQEAAAIEQKIRAEEAEKQRAAEAAKAARERASKTLQDYLQEQMAADLNAVQVLQSFFDRGQLAFAPGASTDLAARLRAGDASGIVLGRSASEEDVVNQWRTYFQAAVQFFSESADAARKARVVSNVELLAGFFRGLEPVENALKISVLGGLLRAVTNPQQRFKGSESHRLLSRFLAVSSTDPGGFLEAAKTSNIDKAVNALFKARSELRLEQPGAELPSSALPFLAAEDLRLLGTLSAAYEGSLEDLKAAVFARSGGIRAGVEKTTDAFFADVSGLLRTETSLESLASRTARTDFETELADLFQQRAGEQGLSKSAADAVSAFLMPETAALIRSVVRTAVLTGEVRALTSTGAVTVQLSAKARALLAAGTRAHFEAAAAELRGAGRAELPASFFESAAVSAREAWFIQSSFLRGREGQGISVLQNQIGDFLKHKNVPLTFGYTAGTAEERLALDLAKLFAGTLTVGRRFGDIFKTSKMGYHVAQADQVVFVMNAETGRIQDPSTEVSRKARGIVGEEAFISPETLNHKEYLLLADLIVHSPYLYGQLKAQEGFSFGVMDQEVLNGILGLINELAETKAAEAVVRASA